MKNPFPLTTELLPGLSCLSAGFIGGGIVMASWVPIIITGVMWGLIFIGIPLVVILNGILKK